MDAATFRAIGTQFSDLIVYPPETVAFWLGVATTRLDPVRWGDLLNEGTYLFVAHNLTLAARFGAGGGAGGASGSGGVVSSKSVGAVSVAYNTELGTLADGGAYNATLYGVQFLQLARLVGMAAIQF